MPETQDVVSPEQQQALDIARHMIDAGIPIFAAPPCPSASGGQCERAGHTSGKEEYDLPPKWQLTVPSSVWLDRWRPGWALAAVGGHAADFLDEDPRNGGTASVQELQAAGHLPQAYGVAATPSGGTHLIIKPLGERKGEALPGLDYQGGQQDGTGRGFVWIAPTVKRSKVDGERRAYVWTQEPDLEWLADSANDESGQPLADRLRAARARQAPTTAPDERGLKEFTETQARAFCDITLKALAAAEIGQIEDRANAAAVQLSHFVPDFWSEEVAFKVLMSHLEQTAYDPEGPSSWTADKFHAVLSGERQRAPRDWKAVRVPDAAAIAAGTEEAPQPAEDAVEALLAEMLSLKEVASRPPKKALVRGLLHLDSEAWLIGEPGSRKSFVALDLAMAVARGAMWQGMQTVQSEVVIIAAEGAGGLGNRIRAWEKRYGTLPDSVHILPRPVQAIDQAAWGVLVEACRRVRPGLVIGDTQARLTVGLEENSAKEMGIYIHAIGRVREATGACVLSVHHTGRDGGNARGSSAIDGAQDTELKVTASKSRPLTGELLVDKQKDLEMLPALPLRFERVDLGEDVEGVAQSSLVLLAPDAWREAEANGSEAMIEPGQEVTIREPGQWAWDHFSHNMHSTERRILQAFADLYSEGQGHTESKIQGVIRERWFGGRPVNKQGKTGHLKAATWEKAWGRVLALRTAEGEPVVANVGGQRWAINPLAGSDIAGQVT